MHAWTVRVPVILRFEDGREYRTTIYVTSYEWGYGEPSFVEKVRELIRKFVLEFTERGYPAAICHPTLQEVLRGTIDKRRYVTPYCADIAMWILEKVHRVMGWDP